jgi:hypothetical protein
MITAKRILALTIALLVAMAMVSAAFGQSEFLFFGYSKYVAGDPDDMGSIMDVYGIMTTVGGVDFPIPVDMLNYEYTVYVSSMVVASNTNEPPTVLNLGYNGGEVRIYKDPLAGGTLADYADPSTFTDGELILHATVQDGWTALLFDFDTDFIFTGSGSGFCDFIGGSQLGDLVVGEYYLEDWGLHGTPVADPNPDQGITVPTGYDRVFDVKLTPPNDPTATDPASWGEIKRLYH